MNIDTKYRIYMRSILLQLFSFLLKVLILKTLNRKHKLFDIFIYFMFYNSICAYNA